MSISMSTAICKTMGLQYPPLLAAVALNLINVLGTLPLQRPGPALAQALLTVTDLARAMEGTDRGMGLTLQLSVALVCGSLRTAVDTAMLLVQPQAQPQSGPNPASAALLSALHRFVPLMPPYDIGLLPRKLAAEEFSAVVGHWVDLQKQMKLVS
ncbi:hypothetical protein B484DRAFT_404989 [Ochromonadaceae sp. CCMP2298]|nr:hypothetical protein B484DRAFT_404989 [Ochromonadaceae sp. CCMP2298]